MNPETLEGMAEMAFKFASDVLINKHDDLMPMFVIHREKPEPATDIIACPFQNDDEKRVMVINVCLEVVEKGCDAWSFLTESWFAHRGPGAPLGPRPSEDPNRLEGVICIASDGKTTELHTWQMVRDEKGVCSQLVPQEKHAGFSSWISNALNQAKALHDRFPESTAKAVELINKYARKSPDND